MPREWGRTRGVVVVAATYVAFLLFAQFGFLDQIRRDLVDPRAIQAVLAIMGLSGLGASLAAGWALGRVGPRSVVRGALVATGLTAFASVAGRGPLWLSLAAAATGAGLGVLTVAVATSLRGLVGHAGAGLAAGIGTGAAYLLSNVPFLFSGSPTVRAVVPGALCLGAAALLPRARAGDADPLGRPDRPETARAPATALRGDTLVPADGGAASFARMLGTFLVLIALDSAAFAVIQVAPALRSATWDGAVHQVIQGSAHFLGAVAAGLVLDRGGLSAALWGTWALFAVAFPLLLHGGPLASVAGPLYAVGISAYSTALVVYPSSGSRPAPRWRAALIYGIAGWLGSALGVGAAPGLDTIPVRAVLGAGAVLGVLWLGTSPRGRAVVLGRYAVTLTLGALGFAASGLLARPAGPGGGAGVPATASARGRVVYVAEGCIHCHSQYVRPGGRDGAWWGPARPLDRLESPPLVGNRRLGPDLREIGARRSPFWNEAHLRQPRLLAPGSRMPSYAHLFGPGARRGPDLVAYLASLGAGDGAARARLVRDAPVGRWARPVSAERGRALFRAWCSACHGPEARGDGPLAALIAMPAMNLRKGRFDLLPAAEPRAAGLERLIRHGLPPTPMPGHETLPDRDVADLVAFVASLVPSGGGS